VPASFVLLLAASYFLAQTIPPLDEVLDGNPAQLPFSTYLHPHGILRRVIRCIAGAHADDLTNPSVPTADEWIGQRLGFLEGHHAFSIAVSISLLQAVGHCTTDAATSHVPSAAPLHLSCGCGYPVRRMLLAR